jgi:biotin transport system substrate-specific component
MTGERTDAVELVDSETVTRLSSAVLLAALTGVLAQFSIPLPGGVPFSLQPFAVFFAGLLVGPLWGSFSMVLYVLVGIAGAPVFSNATAGLGIVLGPTGGFLLSYAVAAALIGYVAHRSLTPKPAPALGVVEVTAGLFVGLATIYAIGVPWLAAVQGLTLVEAGTAMAPFFAGDLLKLAITVGIVRGGDELLDRRP